MRIMNKYLIGFKRSCVFPVIRTFFVWLTSGAEIFVYHGYDPLCRIPFAENRVIRTRFDIRQYRCQDPLFVCPDKHIPPSL